MAKCEESDLIWHFTGADNLYPILKDGILATHQAFMNDRSDCSLCRRVTMATAKILECALDTPRHELPEEYIEMISGLSIGTWHSIYLVCFSAVVDNPLLWRCYTSQGGFAIGVSKDQVRANLDISQSQLSAVRFQDCSYNDWCDVVHKVDDFESAIMHQCARLKDPICDARERAEIQAKVIMESLEMERELAFHKDPFFEGENEVRLAYTYQKPLPISDLLFLGGKPRIRTHLSTPFSSLVKRILVSPFGDKEENLKLAQLLAASIGLSVANVGMYEAPVR